MDVKALGPGWLEFNSQLCLFARCVTLGKPLHLSVSWFVHL